MGFSNALADYLKAGGRTETFDEVFRLLLLMLAPMAPHVTAELWERRGLGSMLATEPWPEYDPGLVVESTVTMVIQVNGKVRDRINVSAEITAADAEALALGSAKIQPWIEGGVRKVIVRSPHVVNLVV